MTQLLTARLALRPPQQSDLEDMFAITSNATAMRYRSSPPHTDRQQTQADLDEMIADMPDTGNTFMFDHGGKVIGWAGCWNTSEIGFILHPDYWRQGLATEALVAIIPNSFAKFQFPSIFAEVDPRNAASIGLLQKLGFSETHRVANTMKVGDEWCDSVYFSLARAQMRSDP